eukprot:scaffold152103_cov24-Tisochrysis_lutea.AAC.1
MAPLRPPPVLSYPAQALPLLTASPLLVAPLVLQNTTVSHRPPPLEPPKTPKSAPPPHAAALARSAVRLKLLL